MEMAKVLNFVEAHFPVIIFVLSLLQLASLFLLLAMIRRLRKQQSWLSNLLKGQEHSSLDEVLDKYCQDVRLVQDQQDALVRELSLLSGKLELAVQRIGFVRYNAFPGAGGELSFSIALLNEKLDGLVLTSIYGRDEARTYAKLITASKGKQNLSEEEQQAIEKARELC